MFGWPLHLFAGEGSFLITFLSSPVWCGHPGGCESVVHGLRVILDIHPDWAVIQVDVANAFNFVSWRVMFEEVRDARGRLHLSYSLFVLFMVLWPLWFTLTILVLVLWFLPDHFL